METSHEHGTFKILCWLIFGFAILILIILILVKYITQYIYKRASNNLDTKDGCLKTLFEVLEITLQNKDNTLEYIHAFIKEIDVVYNSCRKVTAYSNVFYESLYRDRLIMAESYLFQFLESLAPILCKEVQAHVSGDENIASMDILESYKQSIDRMKLVREKLFQSLQCLAEQYVTLLKLTKIITKSMGVEYNGDYKRMEVILKMESEITKEEENSKLFFDCQTDNRKMIDNINIIQADNNIKNSDYSANNVLVRYAVYKKMLGYIEAFFCDFQNLTEITK